jgi:outer membrane protein OmpA-like peptidoglycan-associated protein
MKKTTSIALALATMFTFLSCAGATRQERAAGTGAAVGAGVGAILGQALGHNTAGTVLGAGIGAMAGGIAGDRIGSYMDQQENELRQALKESETAAQRRDAQTRAAAETAVVERTNDVLTATFRSEVLFDFDSADLKPGGREELVRVARILNRYPETQIRIEGHTDTIGTEAYNQQLSLRRADAVKTALVSEGIAPQRIETVGYGKSRPVSSDNAANRRVSIVIKPMARAVG